MKNILSKSEAPGKIQLFLYDLNVELDYNYADPDRDLFPELAPHYAQFSSLPLTKRIVAAYDAIKGTPKDCIFLGIVTGALVRSANVALGKNRTLVVIDIAKDICPEVLSDDLWQHLIFRQVESEIPAWLRALALRLERWQINISLSRKDWKRAIHSVDPTGFETLVRWALTQIARKESDRAGFRQWLFEEAKRRLAKDQLQFQRSEIDIVDTEFRLYDAVEQMDSVVPSIDAASSAAFKENQHMRDELVRGAGPPEADPDFSRATRQEDLQNSGYEEFSA